MEITLKQLLGVLFWDCGLLALICFWIWVQKWDL